VLRLSRAEEVRTQVCGPAGNPVDVSVERSGSVHWQYDAGSGGWELVLAPTLALLNVVSHHVLWRRGWVIRLTVEDRRVWHRRFRSRDGALAELPAILAIATAIGIAGLRAQQGARGE